MKFSVIIPVYNSEDYLRKCLDSILNQGYEDFELIIVDDGSTDSSSELCRSYEQIYGNIRLIRQENSGPSAARNRGIDEARGEYVLFVDSDDWVYPNYFKVLSDASEKGADMVYFGTTHSCGENESVMHFPAAFLRGNAAVVSFVSECYHLGDICSTPNKAFKRTFLLENKIRFPLGTIVEEDLQFVLSDIDSAETLLTVETSLYCYNRRESGSITTKYNPTKFDCKRNAYNAQLELAAKWGDQRLSEIFRDNYLSYVSSCINNLMYKACDLTREEKIAEIRRFYSVNETIDCITHCKGLSSRSRIMHTLIRFKACRLSYLIHFFIFHMRRR